MNNNMFAMMRHFRDLGADAHVFLNEGEFSHFSPEADTWQLERWKPYIHNLPYGDNPRHLFLRRRSTVRRAIQGFDVVLASGLNAAILDRAGMPLAMFCPYSMGIEWIGAQVIRGFRPTALFHRYVRRAQERAVCRARMVVTADLSSLTVEHLTRLRITPHCLMLPMVYQERLPSPESPEVGLTEVVSRIRQSRFAILAHARHHWVENEANNGSFSASKRTDLLIRGFAQFCREHEAHSPLLIFCEYGRDVAASRELVRTLGCERFVFWVPTLPRKKIRVLLSLVHVVAGEFVEEGIWGGTGWEAMAAGRPLLQAVNMSQSTFRAMCSADLPPILDTRSEAQVYAHLKRLCFEPKFCDRTGKAMLAWFERYQGRNLAAQYIRLLTGGRVFRDDNCAASA